MRLAQSIASYLNTTLGVLCLAENVYDIATIAQEAREEKTVSGPALRINREYEILSFDTPILYHRILSAQFQRSNRQGYGDEQNPIIARLRMCMIVFTNKEINSPSDIAEVIVKEWPTRTIKNIVEGVKNTDIIINDAILDESQVFNEEFKGIERFFGPEYCLIKVNYTAESTVLSKCFKNVCK